MPDLSDKFGPLIQWTPIDPITERRYDILPEAAVRFADLMANISPADLGQAVPYIHIHEINPDGSLGRRISNDLYRPPAFGQPLDYRFAERPDVSLESVKIKYHQPQGWILWREMDLNITVHRPQAVFATTTGSFMQSLLDFTKEHAIIYGWSGGSSVIVNGPPPENPDPIRPDPTRKSGFVDFRKGSMIAHDPIPGTQDSIQPDYRQVMPVKGVIRFKATNYNFQIEPDMQVKFQVHAIEDGELASRDAVIFNNRQILPIFNDKNLTLADADKVFNRAITYFTNALTPWIEVLPIEVLDQKTGKKTVQNEKFVPLEIVFNVFLADPLVYSCRSLGYPNIKLHLGLFNKDCPPTSAAYGKRDYANKSIGDFLFPLKYITDMVGRISKTDAQMTAYAMIREIFNILNGAEVWATNATDKFKIPEMQLRTRYNPDSKPPFALFQVLDRKYFIANAKISDFGVGDYKTKAKLKKLARSRGIPVIEFMTKLSYLKDVKFEVVNDEQMKSIFIRRQIPKTRAEIATLDGRNSQLHGGMPGFSMLYRSAIRGTVSMLGNFAFEVFGLIYVDFSIPAYDGVYYIVARDDIISPDGFYTNLTLQAAGTNPLFGGAGGNTEPLPKWITGNGERSMHDWVKAMIVETHPPTPTLGKSH